MNIDGEVLFCNIMEFAEGVKKTFDPVKNTLIRVLPKCVLICLVLYNLFFILSMIRLQVEIMRSIEKPQTINCTDAVWSNMTWYGSIDVRVYYERPVKTGIVETITAYNKTSLISGDEMMLIHRFNVIIDGLRNTLSSMNSEEKLDNTMTITYTTSEWTKNYTFTCDEVQTKKWEILDNWLSEYLFRLTGLDSAFLDYLCFCLLLLILLECGILEIFLNIVEYLKRK